MSLATDPDVAFWSALERRLNPQPKPRRWASPLDLACALDPTIVRTPALEYINARLVELVDTGDSRLLVAMPPQEGKSVLCSKWFPLWCLTINPNLRVAVVSYSDEMARRWGAEIKQLVESFDGTDDALDLEIRLRGDSRAAGRWQVDGHAGGVYCVGIAGSLTGKPVDCFPAGTQILTEYGNALVEYICSATTALPRVLSYNHTTRRAEWRNIVATRTIHNRPLVEIVTTSGRRISCTPEHRIYSADRGYVPAVDLRPGERLVTADRRPDQMLQVRDGNTDAEVGPVAKSPRETPVLLEELPIRGVDPGPDVRRVRQAVHEATGRGREGETQRVCPNLLHEEMLPCVRDGETATADRRGSKTTDPHVSHGCDHQRTSTDYYRTAPLLRRCGRRTIGRDEPFPGLRSLRQGPEVESGHVPGVLAQGPREHLSDRSLLPVQDRVPGHACRARFAGPQRTEAVLLSTRVSSPVDAGSSIWDMRPLRRANEDQWCETPLLLSGVPDSGTGCAEGVEGSNLPTVRRRLRSEIVASGVLHPVLREPGALGTPGWERELALQERVELRRAFPADATADPRTGRPPVPGVRHPGTDDPDRAQDRTSAEVEPDRASPERGGAGQPAGEPDPAVRPVPHDAPQVGYDTVHMVRRLHGCGDTVYDLQVEGNSNFFAGEVLVHNCLIIDDPIKDLSAAQSEPYRKRCRDFWQGVAVPRLGPNAKCLLIQTRWDESDMAGWLLASEGEGDRDKGGRWRVVSIPAQAEQGVPDALGRSPGQYMVSARGDRDWAGIKRSVGPYVWSALYQQRPAPAEGGLFKRVWWRRWVKAPDHYGERIDCAGRIWPVRDCWRFATVDLAASTRTSADWTVAAAWMLTLDGDLVLLDCQRAKVGEAGHFMLVRPLVERWGLDTVFVEAGQYETTLVKEATAAGVPISPLQADTDKLTRALPYSARVAAGRVWLPATAEWVQRWIDEHASFPAGGHDDQVDAGSMACRVAVTKWAPLQPRQLPAKPSGEVDFLNCQL